MDRFNRLPDNLKGIAFLMLASIGFSLMALLIKLLGQQLHVTQILMLRQAGMLLLVSPAVFRGFPGALRSNRPGLQIVRMLFAVVAMLGGFTAIIHLPLADATAIFFAKSFFITIFAMLILGESVGVYRWSAVVVGFVGVIVMLQPGTAEFSIYSLASLAGADTILSWSAIGIGLAMAIPGFYYWQWPTVTEWSLLGGLAVVSYLGQKCNIFAYKHGEASLLASLDYVRLLWATILGFLVFGHFPGLPTWIGAGIVIAAAIFTIYRETRRKQTQAEGPIVRNPLESDT